MMVLSVLSMCGTVLLKGMREKRADLNDLGDERGPRDQRQKKRLR